MITKEQRMKLEEMLAKINKKYGENTIGFGSDLKYIDVPRLSSGSLFLDWALGKNIKDDKAGWPLGRIVEMYGPESSGKSLISMKTIAEAQKAGFACVYFDCENSFDKSFAEKLGVDVNKLFISREAQGEKLLDMACELLAGSDDLRVMIFDSLASMIPTVEVEKSLEEQQMAPMARLMSKGLRKLTASNKNNALIIFINQLRKNPGAGPYANPEYTPGGQSLKFYSSIRIEVKRGDWVEEEEDKGKKKKIGQFVKFRIVKNKTDIPLREGNFKFLYTGEIDKIDEIVSLGILNDLIDRKGAYFQFVGQTFQGREAMEKALLDSTELFELAKKEVFGK